jgi:hypothetical protein
MLIFRDAGSGKIFSVSQSGAVIGREGEGLDVALGYSSISRRHARIYLSGGKWWLEDLGSSNGTFLDGAVLIRPGRLAQGATFAFASHEFVVEKAVVEPYDPEKTELMLPALQGPKSSTACQPLQLTHELEKEKEKENESEWSEITVSIRHDAEHPSSMEYQQVNQNIVGEIESNVSWQANATFDENGDENPTFSVAGHFFRALEYYLILIPKLFVSPMMTVRRQIEEQPLSPMNRWQLLGWAMPGLASSLGFYFFCQFVFLPFVMIQDSGFALKTFLSGLAFIVFGVAISGLLIAFLFHRILRFIVKLFKGDCDEKSRTNYLIAMEAASVIIAVSSGFKLLFGSLEAIHLTSVSLKVLLFFSEAMLAWATVIVSAVAYFWFKAFQVHKAVPLVVLICGALGLASQLANMIVILFKIIF